MNKGWPFKYPVDYENSETVCPPLTITSFSEPSEPVSAMHTNG